MPTPKKAKTPKIVPDPPAHPDEKIVTVTIGDFGHFGPGTVCTAATQAGIRVQQWLAYRLAGHEYQLEAGVNRTPTPCFRFAVVPIDEPESAPQGWDFISIDD